MSAWTEGGHRGSRYWEVPYEDLVARPKKTVDSLCLFLELPFAPETLAYHVGRQRDQLGLSAKKAWLPPTPGLRGWRSQMSERDVALFEALVGDLLSSLGYERATSAPAPAVAALAERYQSWWEAELERRRSRRLSKHQA